MSKTGNTLFMQTACIATAWSKLMLFWNASAEFWVAHVCLLGSHAVQSVGHWSSQPSDIIPSIQGWPIGQSEESTAWSAQTCQPIRVTSLLFCENQLLPAGRPGRSSGIDTTGQVRRAAAPLQAFSLWDLQMKGFFRIIICNKKIDKCLAMDPDSFNSLLLHHQLTFVFLAKSSPCWGTWCTKNETAHCNWWAVAKCVVSLVVAGLPVLGVLQDAHTEKRSTDAKIFGAHFKLTEAHQRGMC